MSEKNKFKMYTTIPKLCNIFVYTIVAFAGHKFRSGHVALEYFVDGMKTVLGNTVGRA